MPRDHAFFAWPNGDKSAAPFAGLAFLGKTDAKMNSLPLVSATGAVSPVIASGHRSEQQSPQETSHKEDSLPRQRESETRMHRGQLLWIKGLVCARSVALAALCCAGVTPAFAQSGGAAFFEPFDRLAPQRWYVSDGWSNGDHQNCTWSKDAVSLRQGVLTLSFLSATSEQPDHLCGEIQTHARYGHGTYEIMMKTDRASGLNAAFFTYIGPVHGAPHEEIDVEILTRDPGQVQFNTYHNGQSGTPALLPLADPADAAYRHYAFQWEADRIRWYVDGVLMHEETKDLPQKAQKIYLSHWGTETLTDWMGPFTPAEVPFTMDVDWMAFTPIATPCQFPESVLCQLP